MNINLYIFIKISYFRINYIIKLFKAEIFIWNEKFWQLTIGKNTHSSFESFIEKNYAGPIVDEEG